MPVVVPLLLHWGLAALEQQLAPGPPPLASYAARLAAVAALLWALRRRLPQLRPLPGDLRPRRVAAYAVLSSLLAAVWVALDRVVPRLALAGERSGLDPFAAYPNPLSLGAFLALRAVDIAVVVAVVEELFYRDAALRFVTSPDAPERVPPGRFSPAAGAASVVLFATSHPEWLAALVFAIAMCALLRQTRSLFACVAVHGATNLLLGLYIVAARDWQLW